MLDRLLERKGTIKAEAYMRLDKSAFRNEFCLNEFADHIISGLSKEETKEALNHIIGGE